MANNVKILKFSGDTDLVVPTLGTERWIQKMNLPVIKDWHAWQSIEGELAGYRKLYKGLTFMTIHGVGHSAIEWARRSSLAMLHSFVFNDPLK